MDAVPHKNPHPACLVQRGRFHMQMRPERNKKPAVNTEGASLANQLHPRNRSAGFRRRNKLRAEATCWRPADGQLAFCHGIVPLQPPGESSPGLRRAPAGYGPHRTFSKELLVCSQPWFQRPHVPEFNATRISGLRLQNKRAVNRRLQIKKSVNAICQQAKIVQIKQVTILSMDSQLFNKYHERYASHFK